MKARVFIPADLEQGKIIGSAVYNPISLASKATTMKSTTVQRTQRQIPLGVRQHQHAAYYAEGSKTLGYEVCEQLGWRGASPLHCAPGQWLPLH